MLDLAKAVGVYEAQPLHRHVGKIAMGMLCMVPFVGLPFIAAGMQAVMG